MLHLERILNGQLEKKAAFTAIAAGASLAIGAVSSLSAAKKAKKAARQARNDQNRIQNQIRNYKRQDLKNPYANVKNEYAGITNPFAGQQVGLKGAEFASEQFSQSQANTLDAIVQGGAQSASTATALGRQAAQFAQGQGAKIQQDEIAAQNRFSQGEARRQELIAGGAQRASALKAQGEQYLLGVRENRDIANLRGFDQQLGNAQYAETSARQAESSAYGNLTKGLISGAVGFAGLPSGGGGKAFRAYNKAQNTRGAIQSVNAFK